ncbi:MAG: AraC family transcriptional regulator [Prevotella sp.]|nr:AraC family transcriptional regulator [Prevotella sp.]
MTKRGNLSLPQLAERYHIRSIFGDSIAYYSSSEGGERDLRAVSNSICCHEFHLIHQGTASVNMGGEDIALHRGDLLLLHPFQPVDCHFPPEVESEGLLLEDEVYQRQLQLGGSDVSIQNLGKPAPFLFHLDEGQLAELGGILKQIKHTIDYTHIYKEEMLHSLVHVCLLFISELPFDRRLVTPDFRHKQNILQIFFTLAHKYFRTERQIGFYADKLNISSTYLSRVVRELTGNSINHYLNNLTFEEACTLLRTSDKNIGEIALGLHFNDQSAFTNFFKAHAGCSPKSYQTKVRG